MRLHRYFGSHADTTLREKRLLLAKVSDFNDPFEFVHRFIGEFTVEHAEKDFSLMPENELLAYLSVLERAESFEGAKCGIYGTPRQRLAEFFVKSGGRPIIDPFHCHKLADDHFRLCCFSTTDVTSDSEILLWSHYARCHQGVRIEFDLDEQKLPLSGVIYSRIRCAIDFAKAYEGNHTNEVLLQSFQTKALAWKYENEVRLIINKDCLEKKPIPLGYRYYFPFAPSSVKSVDFGINCDPETINAVCAILKAGYPDVIVRQAFHHPDDYAIKYLPIT